MFVLKKFLSNFALPNTGNGGEITLGDVAQLVEQRTENPCVGGSIPSITTEISSKRLIVNRLSIAFLFNLQNNLHQSSNLLSSGGYNYFLPSVSYFGIYYATYIIFYAILINLNPYLVFIPP